MDLLMFIFVAVFPVISDAPSESAVKKRIRTLGYLHVFLPNIMMFVAFVLWGVTEVLMCRAWESVVHYAKSDKIVVLAVYGVMILFIVIGVIYVLSKKKEMPCHGAICNWIWDQLAIASGFIFLILPSLQFAVVYFAFGAARGGYYVSIAVPVFYFLSFSCLFKLQGGKSCLELLNKTAWIIYMFIMNTVMVIFYITIVTIKRVNGERAVGDLRVIVFPSESLFAFSLLILLMFGPYKICKTQKELVEK
ncbi:hypothetical protein cypCar_00024245, partial [Cyprinus carpio]